ncbi:MAG TPA: SBBP repeat-containing protein [Pelobium sp.]|nr:SBBP repeat-containing protein [Pelobium sp.]
MEKTLPTNKLSFFACKVSGSRFRCLKVEQRFFKQTRLFFAFVFLVFASFSAKAQDHLFAWATSIVGTDNNIDEGKDIAVDASGNVYATGLFVATADFNPSTGTFNLVSAGGNDAYVQKLDINGNFVWAKRIGGTGSDVGRAITTDASGNIYFAGQFNGTVEFNPNYVAGEPTTTEFTSAGSTDIFVIKLAANGDFIWAKTMGGTAGEDLKSIALDASGNVYITGLFGGTVDFDPNAGTSSLVSNGGADIFIQKLTSNGDFVWAKSMGGTGSDIGYGITTDALGNVYTTGQFNETVEFDPNYTPSGDPSTTALTSAGGNDVFIQKLTSDGSFVWAKRIGDTGSDVGNSIAVDASGNVYTTGQFNGTVEFDPNYTPSDDPSTTSLTSAGGNDVFVQKLTGTGTFVWAKRMGGTGSDVGFSIALDASSNIYTTGQFNGTADFDPGSGTFNLVSKTTNTDTFIQKLNASGNFVWAKGILDQLSGGGFGIAVNASGDVHVTGGFGGGNGVAVDFNPGTDTYNLTAFGTSRDIFVLKLKPDGVTPVDLITFNAKIEGNRTKLSWQTASEQNNNHFAIYRSTDGNTFTLIGDTPGAGTSTKVNTYVFYDNKPHNGTNYYKLVQVDNNGDETIEGNRALSFSLSKIKVDIYPNPSKNKINVQFEKGKYTKLSLVGIDGKVLKSIAIHNTANEMELDITPYPAGIYLVKLTGRESAIHKVVKQ